jgi:hypothetical protein
MALSLDIGPSTLLADSFYFYHQKLLLVPSLLSINNRVFKNKWLLSVTQRYVSKHTMSLKCSLVQKLYECEATNNLSLKAAQVHLDSDTKLL